MKILEIMKDMRVNNCILNALLIVVVSLLALILYWQLCAYNVLEEGEGNYSLDKTVYKQGEPFNIHFVLCKNLDVEESVYGKFVDGVIYTVPEKGSRFDVGCYDTFISSVSIPENLPPGMYTYQETILYHVNPLRTIEYTFTTPEFEVIE